VVVLRDGEGSVYGGYADGAWPAGSGTYLASTAAFLFCLASSMAPAVAPFKMPLNGTYNQYAIYGGDSSYGAAFGGAHDLYVLADGHVNCAIGYTYTPGPTTGATISREAKVAVAAMEVWQLADA
jgi:TLD